MQLKSLRQIMRKEGKDDLTHTGHFEDEKQWETASNVT